MCMSVSPPLTWTSTSAPTIRPRLTTLARTTWLPSTWPSTSSATIAANWPQSRKPLTPRTSPIAARTGGWTARTAEMIRCRETKLACSRRAPRGTCAQNPVGRDVAGPVCAVVVTSLSSAGAPTQLSAKVGADPASPEGLGADARQLELLQPEPVQPTAEGERGRRPVLRVAPALGEVPAVAPGGEDGAFQPPLHPRVGCGGDVGADVHPGEPPVPQRAHRLDDPADLRLEHDQDRVVSEVGVRPVEDEEVREPGDDGAEVRARAVLPLLVQVAAAPAGDGHGGQELGGGEAGAEDDRVDPAFGAVGGEDGVRADLGDALLDHLDLWQPQGRVPLVGHQDPLAAHRVGRGERLPELRVGHLAGQVLAEPGAVGEQQPGLGVEAQRAELVGEVVALAAEPQQAGDPAESGERAGAVGPIGLAQDVGRRALEDGETGHLRCDLRHDLDRAGARAQHRDPLVAEVVPVVPVRGVEERALERVQTGDVGGARSAELAGGGDQDVGLVLGPAGEGEPPAAGGLVEGRREDLAVEPDVRQDGEVTGHVAEVLVDL